MAKTPHPSLLLLVFLLSVTSISAPEPKPNQEADKPFVGVTIGTDASDLLSPAELAQFLRSQQITHVRLYDATPSLLSALNLTGLRLLLGIPNSQLLALASSPSSLSTWVSRHVTPFRPQVSAIALGDDVPPSALPLVLPLLNSLRSLLSAFTPPIPVSTPLNFDLVLNPFPPSQAFFNQALADSFLSPLLGFLSGAASPLMVNLYPYYSFVTSRGVIPSDNALFEPLPPAREMVDPNTLLHYTNVFDAMVDAVYFSMRNLNVTGVRVLVTETGWPSLGSGVERPFATRDNADTFNSNLIKHVLDRSGTPLHPEVQPSVYIYELFNEDLRPGPLSERNWGLFYGNGTPVYLLRVEGSGGFLANDTTNRTFCVASEEVDVKQLQAALDWACGPGRANCSEIQPGEACYDPNNVRSHASYAFDSYYRTEGRTTGSCYFQGAAMVTTTDPSEYQN